MITPPERLELAIDGTRIAGVAINIISYHILVYIIMYHNKL